MEIKYCIDCKHHEKRPSDAHACRHPSHQKPDSLVTGAAEPMYCEVMRIQGQPCGTVGMLWEEK